MTIYREPGAVALTAPPGFLVKPTQQASESAGGFLLRLADLNGIKPLWSNANQGTSITSPGLGIARWCPLCLSAPGAYWSVYWTEGAAICRQHCCWLRDRCDECGAPAAWRRLRLRQCRCGADLALQPAAPWSASLRTLLQAPEDIAEHCIRSADEGQRLTLAEVVGALDRYGLQGKPLKRSSARAVQHQQGVVERGALIVVHAAGEIGPLLERLRVPPPAGQGAQLLGEAWPGLLRLLKRRLRGPMLDWLTNRIQQFGACASSEIVPIQRGRTGGSSPSGMHGLARAIGVRFERVPTLLSDCGASVPTRSSKSGRKMSVVSDTVVSRVRDHLLDLLCGRAAQRRFGLTAKRLEVLVRAGLVRRVGDRYSASSIQLLLERSADPAEAETSDGTPDQRKWCSLHQALRLHVGHRQTETLFMALLGGLLPVRRAGQRVTHVRDLLLLEPEVKAWSQAGEAVAEVLTIP